MKREKERERPRCICQKNYKERNQKPEKEFDCNIYLLIRNSCKRCVYQLICEESDRDEGDKGRQDKKLSNSSIQREMETEHFQKKRKKNSKENYKKK